MQDSLAHPPPAVAREAVQAQAPHEKVPAVVSEPATPIAYVSYHVNAYNIDRCSSRQDHQPPEERPQKPLTEDPTNAAADEVQRVGPL